MRLIISAIFLLSLLSSSAQESNRWITDYEQAIDLSKKKGVPVLISFSGSDWCRPCMLLSKTIFETNRFHSFAKDSLVLLNIDFPKRKKNSPLKNEMIKREKLAEKYNKNGSFPLIIIIDQKGNVLGKTGYKKNTVNEYIDHIKTLMKDFYITDKLKEKSQIYKKSDVLMGSNFEIAAIHDDEEFALDIIDSAYKEIARIEHLISSWNENSQTSLINQNAGIVPVVVDLELFNLIKRSKKISTITDGAFDISYASMDEIWVFNQSNTDMPSKKSILSSVAKINYENIILNENENSVFLKEKGMKIGFGGIGKGYAANKARYLMIQMGITNGMVNAGGDLIAWGNGINDKKWKVGIADPKKKNKFISWLEIQDQAIVTSGNYERFLIIDNIRYSHIIDPRTGYPSRGIKSVTVICPDAELADALATSVFVLGTEKGIELINQMEGFECIIVNDTDEFIVSKGINLELLYSSQANKS